MKTRLNITHVIW